MQAIEIRAIRTAIAVGSSIFIADKLKVDPMSDSSFYAGIAAAIATQAFFRDTLKVGIGRIYSTLIGAIAAGCVLSLLPISPIVLGLSTGLLVYVCNKFLKLSQSNIACIVLLGISVNLDADVSPVDYVIQRMVDTSVGVTCAILTSLLIFIKKEQKDLPE